MALPRRQQMRALTLEALRSGIHWFDNIREYIARKAETPIDWRFTNAHAWALVDLQASGEVVKQGRREYALAQEAAEAAREPIPEPWEGHFPRWRARWLRMPIGRMARQARASQRPT